MDDDERGLQLYPTLPHQNDLNKAENGVSQNINGKHASEALSTKMGNPDALEGEKKDYKYFWRRVLNDLTNKDLIPVKILFFFKFATLFVLYPFLTLHMDSLGLDAWEIGINQASVPIVAILGPPVSGVIADKIGNFKIVLTGLTLANAAVALLLLLVPVARETVKLPTSVTFEIGCDSPTHYFTLQSIDPYDCALVSTELSKLPKHNILMCGQLCHNDYAENNRTAHDLEVLPEFPLSPYSNFSLSLRNESYTFYPNFENKPKFECHIDGTSFPVQTAEECELISTRYSIIDASNDGAATLDKYFSRVSLSKLKLLQERESGSNTNMTVVNVTTHPRFRIEGSIKFDDELHDNPKCNQQSLGKTATLDATSSNDCETKCFLQMERKAICSNDSVRKVYNVWLTFGVYTAFRLLLGFFSATSFIMFEGAVLAILKQFGGDYGLQRVSASFAAMLAAPLSGVLLQYYSFRPIFYLYAGLQTFSAFLTLKIDLKFKKPSDNVIGHLREVLSQAEILIFFVAMLCSGTAWGYLETFLFLFLKQLGGSKTLMGLTISVGGLFGLPFLIFSRPLIKRVGHVNILCIGLLFYGIRYFGYSFIYNPWLCLPFEALESITASLAITAAATYAVALSTMQTIATVQGIMGALYFGIGRGLGSFIGGVLIKRLGHRQTLQIFGIASFVASVLYMLVNILYIRRNSKLNKETDSNNANALVISNGSAKMKPEENKEQFQLKPANHDSDFGYGKVNPGFEEGDGDDGNRFTDIPLDEDNTSTLPHNNNKNCK